MNDSPMQVVILAGGLGTRIRSVAGDLPKALLPVAGKPFIEHQLDLLRMHKMMDILLCIGYQGEVLMKHLGDGSSFGVSIAYSQDPPAGLLGTGGALVRALPFLKESFLVLYGDSYLPTDYTAVGHAFRESSACAMMCVYKNDGKWDKSNVRLSGGKIVYYSKNADPAEADHIDYGLSGYRREVIESYSNQTLPFGADLIQQDLVGRGEMDAYVVHERFYEIGKPEGLAELDGLLRAQRGSKGKMFS
jgi:MurNAc alpha-1-phosphate uridylyltransferase